MNKILIVLLIFLPSFVYSTVGEPAFINELYYYPKKNEIHYLYNAGQWDEIKKIQLKNFKTSLVISGEDGDNDKKIEANLNLLRKQGILLKPINIKKLGLSFKSKLHSTTKYTDKQGKVSDPIDLEYSSWPFNIKWLITPYYKQQQQKSALISSCFYNTMVNFRGYAVKDKKFIVIVATTLDWCAEYGYTGEFAFVIKDVNVSESMFLKPDKSMKKEMGNQYGTVINKTEGGIYQNLDSGIEVAYLLNKIGYQAYQEQSYEIAIKYFKASYQHQKKEKKFLLPLYNLACTEAKIGQIDDSFKSLEELLSFKKSKQKYIEKIKKDPDLEKVRQDKRFKRLIK